MSHKNSVNYSVDTMSGESYQLSYYYKNEDENRSRFDSNNEKIESSLNLIRKKFSCAERKQFLFNLLSVLLHITTLCVLLSIYKEDKPMTFRQKTQCPESWIYARHLKLGCLLHHQEGMSWFDATKFCKNQFNAHLIEIHTKAQFDFAVDQFKASSWWSGGTDVFREGDWIWSHSLLPVPDFVWNSGQPDNSSINLDYLCFNTGSRQFGSDCSSSYDRGFPVCQIII